MNCVICENPIIDRNSRKYCSEKCATRAESIHRAERINSLRVKVVKKCVHCGKEFSPHVRNKFQTYCSPSCRRKEKFKRDKETGKYNFEYARGYAKKNIKRKNEMNDIYHDRIRFGGNKYPVLDRDGQKCTKCGKIKGLIIHHIDGSGHDKNPNNSMDNLTTLCRSCHMRHHASGDRNYLYKELTVEMYNLAKEGSKSLFDMAIKLNMHRDTLRRKAKELGLATDIRRELKLNK